MQTVSESSYNDLLNSSVPTLIDFSASWCVPCQQLAKTLEAMESDYDGQVNFVKMDIDECPEITSSLGIRSVPTLLLLKDGEIQTMLVGVQSRAKLDSVLKQM